MREPTSYSFKGARTFFTNFIGSKRLLFYKDDPITSVGVIEWPYVQELDATPLSIMVNGKSDSNTVFDLYTLKMSAHLPALLSGSRKQAMVIGLGTGVTAAELSLYSDIERIDVAEISPAVIDALPLFRDSTYHLHENPRVHIQFGDAFRVLGRSDQQWDIIISEPSNPWVTGVDMLFTQEFYRLIKDHLTADGMLTQWIHIYAANPEMAGMALNTLQEEFRYCRGFLANPGDLMILASNRPIPPDRLAKAEDSIQQNSQVKASLDVINLGSIDALLSRELWSPSYIRTQFREAGIQTMDNPRLHYIAGKQYFMGNHVPFDFLFNATTANFWEEHLLAQKYPNWLTLSLSPHKLDSLLLAVQDVVAHSVLPTFDSLLLKAHLSAPERVLLDEARQHQLRPDLVHLISTPGASEDLWEKAGLQGASFREKATLLLQHIQHTRNWIVPYPLDGLKSLLEQGVANGQDAYEKNWSTLQLALLLVTEYHNLNRARLLLQQILTDAHGVPLFTESEYNLVTKINRAFTQSSILSNE